MIDSHNFWHILGLPIKVGGFIICFFYGLKPILANEQLTQNPQPFMSATGTVEDLEGVESRDISEPLWGMGGAYSDNTEANTTYESQESPWVAKTQALNLTLKKSDLMLGDLHRPTLRFPVPDF